MRLPLSLVGEIAPGADPAGSPADWEFTSEGVKWRAKAGVQITQGRDDEDSEVTAGGCQLTFDDRTGKLSPRNVLGEWYGQIGKNTPIRFVLDTVDDEFDRVRSGTGWGTEPSTGATWENLGTITNFSTTGSAATVTLVSANLAVATGLWSDPVGFDVDIYSTAAMPAVMTGAAWVHGTQVRYIDSDNYYLMHTEFQPDGTIQLKVTWVNGGSFTNIVGLTATGITYTAGTLVHTHVQAIGKTLQMRIWKNSDPEPTTWQVSTEHSALDGTKFGFFEWRVVGNTNVGSLTISITDVQVRTTLFGGTVPEWPVRWPNKSGADCITPVTAAGLLRYLNQGLEALRSPLDLQLSGQSPGAYWKLEDGSNATGGGSGVPGGATARITDAEFGNDDAPPGALSSLSLGTLGTSKVTGTVTTWPTALGTTGYTFIGLAKFDALPAASPAAPFVEINASGRVVRWVITADAATFNLTGYDSADATVVTTGGITYEIDPTEWFAINIKASQSGGTVTYEMLWHQVGSATFYGVSSTFSGTAIKPHSAAMIAPVAGTLVTHMFLGGPTVVFNSADFADGSKAFAGEDAAARIARVAGDAGVEVMISEGDSEPLGPQPRAATTIDVIRDAEKADLGLLYESGPVLRYLPHSARMNVPVAMELDWEAGHLFEPPEPVDDDLRLRNKWTGRMPDGTERTVEDAASVARYRRIPESDSFNVADDGQLLDVIGWKLAEGTMDQLRWPRMSINLIGNPELVTQWLGCRVGSRITIANAPGQIAGEVIDLIIEGYSQTLGKHTWIVELNCSPAAPWSEVGVWDESRADSGSTIVATSFNDSTTSIAIKTLDVLETWYTPGGYTWDINGEPFEVTSVTSPVLSGGYYTQTATVAARGDLAKAHVAGESVRLRVPARWGF